MKLNEETRGTTPKVRVSYLPVPCQHCQTAPCMLAATGGAIYRQPNGLVVIDPVKAAGQKQVVDACPYGAIYWNDTLNIPQKCTGCAHLVDDAPLTGQPMAMPRCVDACPTQALKFGEYDDIKGDWDTAHVLHPEYNTDPLVRYVDTPKRFITGALYDPLKDECLQGAVVRAVDIEGGISQITTSDEFGDFWLEPLDPNHVYQVSIMMQGYYEKVFGGVGTSVDVNLGDIALYEDTGPDTGR